MPILFQNTTFHILAAKEIQIQAWLAHLALSENFKIGKLSYIFVDDEKLHSINLEFLNHDTYTDIITFDYNQGSFVFGEIYVSMDRISENSKLQNQDFKTELYRIIAHGLLHLVGYKDKSPTDKMIMTQKEDYYLSLLPQFLD